LDLSVRLSAPGANPVTVHYATADNSASGFSACNSDYVPNTGNLTYAPGETSKTIRVQILDCSPVEPFETFTLNLSAPAGATIARASTTVGIADATAFPLPNATAPPALSGTTQVGQTLGTSTGAWTGSPTGFQYAWERCNAAGGACGVIGGAT